MCLALTTAWGAWESLAGELHSSLMPAIKEQLSQSLLLHIHLNKASRQAAQGVAMPVDDLRRFRLQTVDMSARFWQAIL